MDIPFQRLPLRPKYEAPYERFALIEPPRVRARQQVLTTAQWAERFAVLAGDDQRGHELARNRQIVFGIAALSAGVGLLVGAVIIGSLQSCHCDRRSGAP